MNWRVIVVGVAVGGGLAGLGCAAEVRETRVEVSSQAIAAVAEAQPVVVSTEGAVTQAPAVEILASTPAVQQARPAAQERPAGGFPVKGGFNLNINYPGAAFRYFLAEGKALELLGQAQSGVSVAGLRYYLYPGSLRQGGLLPYFGFEADYLNFKGPDSKGHGLGGGAFAGAEYFMGRRVSAQTDLGAVYVRITDKDTSLTENGLEFVINLGFNVYFGGGL